MTLANLSGTGIGRLSGAGEALANEVAIEAATKRAKSGRLGTHEGRILREDGKFVPKAKLKVEG